MTEQKQMSMEEALSLLEEAKEVLEVVSELHTLTDPEHSDSRHMWLLLTVGHVRKARSIMDRLKGV